MNEPTPQIAARRALYLLSKQEEFCKDSPAPVEPDDLDAAFRDTLADLMHLAHQRGIDFEEEVERACNHFEAEILELEQELNHE